MCIGWGDTTLDKQNSDKLFMFPAGAPHGQLPRVLKDPVQPPAENQSPTEVGESVRKLQQAGTGAALSEQWVPVVALACSLIMMFLLT